MYNNVLASAIVEPASISGGAAKCMQKFLSHGLPIDLRLCLYQSVVCVCVTENRYDLARFVNAQKSAAHCAAPLFAEN